jgi:hypothetical protein
VELYFNKRRNQMLGNHGTLEPKVKELTGKSIVLEKMNRHAVKDGKSGRSSPVVKGDIQVLLNAFPFMFK